MLSLTVFVAATPIPTGGYDGYWSPPSTPEKVNLEIFACFATTAKPRGRR
jgi:hypothetical protein